LFNAALERTFEIKKIPIEPALNSERGEEPGVVRR
jgi:hypothetical protein